MESIPTHPSKEEQEALKNKVLTFTSTKLEEAFSLLQQNQESQNKKDIIEYLLDVWSENDGVPWKRRPRFYVPDTDIIVRFESQTTEFDANNKTISLAIGLIRSAENKEQLELAFIHLLQSLHHEVEHIYHPGYELSDPDSVQEKINYLSNEGEIKAHAQEYSYRYGKEYPSESFDLEKMRSLAIKLNEEGKPNARNYFIVFADPEKQEKYRNYGDIKEVYYKIVKAIDEILRLK